MRFAYLAVFLVAAVAGADEEAPPASAAQELEIPAGKHGTFPAYIPATATPQHPCPLLVACHGHGDTAANFLACARPVADAGGFAVLAPEGTEKLAEKGFGWNDFPDRADTLLAAVKTLLKGHPEVDPKRIVWWGHSAGCAVCCRDAAPHPESCQGIVLTACPTANLTCAAKGPKPRVCLMLGTKDPNFEFIEEYRKALKEAKLPACSVNQITDLEHAVPAREYLVGAIHWVLAPEGASEENVLPKDPPALTDRVCRHLLIRFKGAEGAGDDVKRAADAARKEALRLQEVLRKQKKPEGRAEQVRKSSEDAGTREGGGALTEEAVEPFGALLRWACWTTPQGEIRLVRTPSGFHLVWAER